MWHINKHIYIYIYTYGNAEIAARVCMTHKLLPPSHQCKAGIYAWTHWASANFMLFDGAAFWVLRLSYFYLPESARTYLFPPIRQN